MSAKADIIGESEASDTDEREQERQRQREKEEKKEETEPTEGDQAQQTAAVTAYIRRIDNFRLVHQGGLQNQVDDSDWKTWSPHIRTDTFNNFKRDYNSLRFSALEFVQWMEHKNGGAWPSVVNDMRQITAWDRRRLKKAKKVKQAQKEKPLPNMPDPTDSDSCSSRSRSPSSNRHSIKKFAKSKYNHNQRKFRKRKRSSSRSLSPRSRKKRRLNNHWYRNRPSSSPNSTHSNAHNHNKKKKEPKKPQHQTENTDIYHKMDYHSNFNHLAQTQYVSSNDNDNDKQERSSNDDLLSLQFDDEYESKKQKQKHRKKVKKYKNRKNKKYKNHPNERENDKKYKKREGRGGENDIDSVDDDEYHSDSDDSKEREGHKHEPPTYTLVDDIERKKNKREEMWGKHIISDPLNAYIRFYLISQGPDAAQTQRNMMICIGHPDGLWMDNKIKLFIACHSSCNFLLYAYICTNALILYNKDHDKNRTRGHIARYLHALRYCHYLYNEYSMTKIVPSAINSTVFALCSRKIHPFQLPSILIVKLSAISGSSPHSLSSSFYPPEIEKCARWNTSICTDKKCTKTHRCFASASCGLPLNPWSRCNLNANHGNSSSNNTNNNNNNNRPQYRRYYRPQNQYRSRAPNPYYSRYRGRGRPRGR